MIKIGSNSAKYPLSPITERLHGVFSIVCFVSSMDSPDIIVKDIAALSALSPNCKVVIVSELEIHDVFSGFSNLRQMLIIPDRKDRSASRLFLKNCAKTKTDILYCRNAEENVYLRKCMSKINAGIAIVVGSPLKKIAFKGQVLRLEDESMTLRDAMPFIPETKVDWQLAPEVLKITKTFLKEKGVKRDFFCVDVALERNFYDFFDKYEDNSVSFLFIGNSAMEFSNEGSKILYCGDVADSYVSALVSLSKGSLTVNNDVLITETNRFGKRLLMVDGNRSDLSKIKFFVEQQ